MMIDEYQEAEELISQYINVYTNDEVTDLLKDFSNIKIEQNHIFPYKIDEYKKYEYVKKDYFQIMPLNWHEILPLHYLVVR